jgi:hypothetical protein
MQVMTQKKRLAEVTDQSWRRGRHRDEVQKNVRTEHDKNESEKDAGNDGQNLHGGDGKLI